jgi:hypothetical protein
MHQAIGYTFDYDFAAEDIFQKQHIIEDFEAYNTPEGNMDIFKSCTSRAGFYETRESMRETL